MRGRRLFGCCWTLARRGFLAALCVLVAVAAAPGDALAERRVALLIGNGSYANAPQLANPVNDAVDLSEALRRLAFQEVVIRTNRTLNELRGDLRDFAALARTADVAMIFFAGHGVSVRNKTWLLPVDARLSRVEDVDFEAAPLELMLRAVEGAKRLKLVAIDACRDNPFLNRMAANPGATRSLGRGLAKVEPPADSLVWYAARDGQLALDGQGRNSPFATALLKRIETPGVELDKLFRLVRNDVIQATDGAQEPFRYGSRGVEDFFFKPDAAPAPAAGPPALSPGAPAPGTGTGTSPGSGSGLEATVAAAPAETPAAPAETATEVAAVPAAPAPEAVQDPVETETETAGAEPARPERGIAPGDAPPPRLRPTRPRPAAATAKPRPAAARPEPDPPKRVATAARPGDPEPPAEPAPPQGAAPNNRDRAGRLIDKVLPGVGSLLRGDQATAGRPGDNRPVRIEASIWGRRGTETRCQAEAALTDGRLQLNRARYRCGEATLMLSLESDVDGTLIKTGRLWLDGDSVRLRGNGWRFVGRTRNLPKVSVRVRF